eukprot:CAMPEP_0194132210 /NCGR_PEP_ID=MMETSP0152-20130528/2733_1 /TAXON_ID=1049557 /ORGANISM="Thalassiothrix antarctica, Strain L6-D1" /LENGTH=774 /DNA_ID=CAMNT_0038827181 /DNA_START=44 /DNA_END=2368 /DNA_ORIENTATION=-
MMKLDSELLVKRLSEILLGKDIEGLDKDLVEYIVGLLTEGLEEITEDAIEEMMGPFLESVVCPDEISQQAKQVVLDMGSSLNSSLLNLDAGTKKLKQGLVNMKLDSDLSEADQDANKYLWGTDSKVHELTNASMEQKLKSSAKDRRKERQELEKARREFQAKIEQQREDAAGEVAAMVLPDYTSGRNERDVQIKNVSLSLDSGCLLLDSGELKFTHKRRYGLVGKNGVGKTTLLKAIASRQVDGVGIEVLRHLRILHVRQEIESKGGVVSVIKTVLDSDVERLSLLKEEASILKRLEQDSENISKEIVGPIEDRHKNLKDSGIDPKNIEFQDDLKRLDQVHARLQVLGADSAEARASMILSGLQFTPEMQTGPTSALSGGWRMRVALAAALFIEPDILMLDEPTNHLDLEAVLWLESYLVEYNHTVIVVSHDRGFLNEVCTDIIEFVHQRLTYYRGNYDTYVKTASEKIKNAMRVYQAYQDKRAHMMEFITKFRANAKRATMVQSRIKAVEKMDIGAPEPVEVETVWTFKIPNPEPIGRPIIAIDDVSFDYDKKKIDESEFLLQKINFGVDLTSRIGILGANGAGKSTLLNLIMGQLNPIYGNCTVNARLRIGHFTQHSADKFDLRLSAVENMLNLFEYAEDQEMRCFVGKFQIQGVDAIKPMFLLSGGQKSRVAFASLAYQKPHVIVMDEPTNHLDMESIDALVQAIQDFKGGLIVVSHDQYFISNTCSELWVVGGGVGTRFRGNFDEYKKHTLEKTRKRVEASVKSLSTIND